MNYLICGNYGANNHGDELILAGIIKTLRNIDPTAHIIAQSANPSQTKTLHEIPSVPHFPAGLRSLFKKNTQSKAALSQADYYILGGGGLFASLKFKANIIWAIQALHALKADKKLIIYGQSLENLKNPITKFIVKQIFKRAKFIAMRDQQSIAYLHKLQIKNVHLIPDPALNPEPKIPHQSFTALCLRGHCPFSKNPRFIATLKKQIPKNSKSIPFHPKQDTPFHLKVAPHAPIVSPLELKKAQKALCMRLHSIIACINYDIPFQAISYSPKVKNFLETWNLQSSLQNYLPKSTLQTLRQKITQEQKKAQKLLKDFLESQSP